MTSLASTSTRTSIKRSITSTSISATSLSTSISTSANKVSSQSDKMAQQWNQLSSVWGKESFPGADKQKALRRALPLLEDPTAVPFVCRYRADVIFPLSTKEIHQLSGMLQTYKSLDPLRQKILDKVPAEALTKDPKLKQRVETSISKSELDDLYAPYKPPSKGSLEDRIKNEHPDLIVKVDAFWNDSSDKNHNRAIQNDKRQSEITTLLANKIASHTATTDALLEYVGRFARIQTTKASPPKDAKPKSLEENDKKYSTYYDFSASFHMIRDHQVLAIRRAINNKALKLTYDLDGDRTESRIRRSLLDEGVQSHRSFVADVWRDATHDAWSRLLRKRITTRLWKDQCGQAEEKSIRVFCDNLQKALLMPPLANPQPLLALDPGYQAGIKIAVLDKNGQLLLGNEDADASLSTVKFLGNRKEEGIQMLIGYLQMLHSIQEDVNESSLSIGRGGKPKKRLVTVALGNGHGSQEARDLIRAASDKSGIPIDIQLVNEAGASVWSVTEGALREFPSQQPAAVAAVSIGRRYQNPLPELVKIPPRSLGLGMYQHDLSEKELDEKLHITSVQAVAEVGVDANACSQEILERIPGLTTKLCERIIKARPLLARHDLLKVTGLGPKTFENCAAFIRIEDGKQPLDTTLVHPESYEVAQYLLKQLKWDLNDKKSIRKSDLPTSKEGRIELWGSIMEKAAAKYDMTADRVSSVIDHLVVSITNPDPRLGGNLSIVGGSASSAASASTRGPSNVGNIDGCSLLPSNLSTSMDALRKACPLRGILASVRNVVDFGAFVDIGFENDGLIHRSKTGSVSLSSFLVGQEIGVDILSVSDTGRVSVALTGLNLNPDPVRENKSNGKRSYSTTATASKKPPAKRQRVIKSEPDPAREKNSSRKVSSSTTESKKPPAKRQRVIEIDQSPVREKKSKGKSSSSTTASKKPPAKRQRLIEIDQSPAKGKPSSSTKASKKPPAKRQRAIEID